MKLITLIVWALVSGGGMALRTQLRSTSEEFAWLVRLTFDNPSPDLRGVPVPAVSNFHVWDTDKERWLAYTGMVVKVANERPLELLTVHPWDTLDVELDLSLGFAFQGNQHYVLSYGDTEAEILTYFASQTPAEQYQRARLRYTTTGCSTTQQQANTLAMTIATQALVRAVDGYTVPGCVDTRYDVCFGAYNSQRYTQVKNTFAAIKALQDQTVLVCNPSQCESNWYAFVFPSDPTRSIFLCPLYFSLGVPATTLAGIQDNSQAGILIHEISHFVGTDDFAYGVSAVQTLALTNPANAVRNADSYEYFVERQQRTGCCTTETTCAGCYAQSQCDWCSTGACMNVPLQNRCSNIFPCPTTTTPAPTPTPAPPNQGSSNTDTAASATIRFKRPYPTTIAELLALRAELLDVLRNITRSSAGVRVDHIRAGSPIFLDFTLSPVVPALSTVAQRLQLVRDALAVGETAGSALTTARADFAYEVTLSSLRTQQCDDYVWIVPGDCSAGIATANVHLWSLMPCMALAALFVYWFDQ